MSIDLDDAFGAYSREELEETLRGMDPKKDPKDYAAIKAASARALPEGVAGSCLDVAALRKLEVTIQPTNGGKVWAVVLAVVGTFVLTRRFLDHPVKDLTAYWVGAVALIAAVLFLWIVAARRAVTVYRFSNGTGWRSKNQRNFEVPGPQNGHRVARGAGSHPEPAYCGIDGTFQVA